jgi:hypothetical protein
VTVTSPAPATGCSSETADRYHGIGDFAETNCTERTISFNFTRTANGAELDIFWSFAAPGLLKGTYLIPGDQIVHSGEGTSDYEDYTGPRDFSVSNLTLLHSVWGN